MRKKQKLLGIVQFIALILVSIVLMTSCGTSADTKETTKSEITDNIEKTASGDEDRSGSDSDTQTTNKSENQYEEEIVIDFYIATANEQGLSSGYSKKILKEKFNMDFNVIAPNVAGGEVVYQTRSAAGNLGDIAMLTSTQLSEAVNAGLFMEITDLYNERGQNIFPYQKYVDAMNDNIEKEGMYLIPCDMSTWDPMTVIPTASGAMLCSQDGPMSSIRWDLYKEIGSPEIKSMDDILPIFKQLQEVSPESESGKPTYPLSLFKDWDGYLMYNVYGSFPAFYGYAVLAGNSTIMTYGDPTDFKTQRIDDDEGYYYKTLKLFFEANQMGLIDPDSTTQTWDILTQKTKDGQVLFGWWAWSTMPHYNNSERGNAETPKGFEFVPITDAKYYAGGFNPSSQYGEGLGIGANTKHAERIMDFMNWSATDEGILFRYNGPKGLAWDMEDGMPYITEFGKKALNDPETPVDESWGGGTWVSGNRSYKGPVTGLDINPATGNSYMMAFWPDILDMHTTKLDLEWREEMGARDMVEYCTQNDKYALSPGNLFVPPEDSFEIKDMRSMCGTFVTDASWQMVFASDEAEFDRIWENMKTQIYGTGWEEVVAVDMEIAKAFNAACLETIELSK